MYKRQTRDTIINLVRDLGYEIIERDLTRMELYTCDEAFFTGTAAEVTAIAEVDRKVIADGKPGPITTAIKNAYIDVVMGRNEKYLHWLTPVY